MEKLAHDGKLFRWVNEKGGNKKVYLKYGTEDCQTELAYQTKMKIFEAKRYVNEKVESGAFGRCVKELLGLKSWYLAEQLAKPFIIVRIVRNDEYMLADPEGRKMLFQAAIDGSSTLFGVGQQAPRQLTEGNATPQIQGDRVPTATEDEEEKLHAYEVVDHPIEEREAESEPHAGAQISLDISQTKP